jgi:hypothetical protein
MFWLVAIRIFEAIHINEAMNCAASIKALGLTGLNLVH